MHPLKQVFYALVVVITLSVAFAAFAQVGSAPITPQNPCGVPEPKIVKPYHDLADQPGKRFSCAPAPAGSGAAPTYKIHPQGVVAWWYCPDKVPNPTVYHHAMVVGTWERLMTGNLKVDTPMADPSLTPIWCPYVEEIYANYPKVVVPDPPGTWKTASSVIYNSNASSLTGFVGIGAKGVTCDCTRKLVVGSATYCTFTGAANPNQVSQCSKSP